MLEVFYNNLLDFYVKGPDGLSKADKNLTTPSSTPSALVSEESKGGWGWFKKRSARPEKPSSPLLSTGSATVKHTGTNYDIIHNSSTPAVLQTFSTPKGIYIWGGPGCGKTYLMDLLFNSIQCPDIKKARVDFHSFMLEINMKLHQLRQKYGQFLL